MVSWLVAAAAVIADTLLASTAVTAALKAGLTGVMSLVAASVAASDMLSAEMRAPDDAMTLMMAVLFPELWSYV